MADDDQDYSPVGIYSDDEELAKYPYPPVAPSPSGDMAAPAYPPVAAAPPGGSPFPSPYSAGSTDDLEMRAAHPIHPAQSPVETERPQWGDYAPPQPQGFWSKLGHGLAAINPRTNEYFNVRPEKQAEEAYKNATTEYEAPAVENQREAVTEEAQARADALRRPPQEEWENQPGLVGPNNEPIEREKRSGQYRVGQLPGGAKPLSTKSPTQEQNKLDYQNIIGKIDAAGLSTDPKTIDKSLDAALKNGTITKEEHASAKSYEAANPTPGTNLTVHLAGEAQSNEDALNKMFEGKEVIAHMPDGSRQQMSYADAKAQNIPRERLVALTAKEAQENRDKGASTDATFKALDTYRADFKKAAPHLTELDRSALDSLTQHGHDGSTAGLLSGFLDEIPVAGPVTGLVNKIVQGGLMGGSYQKLSPEGKKLVSDYFTVVISNFANMKNIMGSVGRNPMQLQAEINTVPMPSLDWESASAAFDNKRDDLRRRAGSMPSIYQPKQ